MASAQARAALVARLEKELTERPGRYRLRLALLAGLGYGVLGGALVLALAMSVGLLALLVLTKSVWLVKLIKVIWIPIVVAWLILRALWVRIDPPSGVRLRAAQAPELFAEIERVRHATGAPRLAGVVVDPDLNAGAVAVPRLLGLLGHRHWLVLGLPLMQALDRAQFASVLAHEFGHMGGGHGRFSGWIYRVRMTWYRLLAAMEARDPGRAGWLQRFFDWYAPYFDACSFALARSNEYEADAMAARVAGHEAAGHALLRVNLAAQRLERDFWPGLSRANAQSAQPPATLYADLASSLQTPCEQEDERLQQILRRPSGLEDTHPVPALRLAALGVAPVLPPPVQRSAASELLGPLEAELAAQFSQHWIAANGEAWSHHHAQAAERRARLAEFEAQDAAGFTTEKLIEYAVLLETLRDEATALPWYRRALEAGPDDAVAHFQLGRVLAGRDDPDAVALLRRAMALDAGCTGAALELLHGLHSRLGQAELLAALEEEGREHARQAQRANVERQRLHKRDVFRPHGLDGETLEAFARTIREVGGIARVWVARKHIEPDYGVPHFVLVVKWKMFAAVTENRLQRLVDAATLPGTAVAIALGSARAVERRVRKAAGEAVRPRA